MCAFSAKSKIIAQMKSDSAHEGRKAFNLEDRF